MVTQANTYNGSLLECIFGLAQFFPQEHLTIEARDRKRAKAKQTEAVLYKWHIMLAIVRIIK